MFCLPYNKFIWQIILLFYSLCVFITLKRGGSKWTLYRSQHSFSTPVVKGLIYICFRYTYPEFEIVLIDQPNKDIYNKRQIIKKTVFFVDFPHLTKIVGMGRNVADDPIPSQLAPWFILVCMIKLLKISRCLEIINQKWGIWFSVLRNLRAQTQQRTLMSQLVPARKKPLTKNQKVFVFTLT